MKFNTPFDIKFNTSFDITFDTSFDIKCNTSFDINSMANLTLQIIFHFFAGGVGRIPQDFPGENDKYGPIDRVLNRASDDSDSDLDTRAKRREFLSRKSLKRSEITDCVTGPVGLEFLVRQREVAKYEAMKRPDYCPEAFQKAYPEYEFDKSHTHITVKVGLTLNT